MEELMSTPIKNSLKRESSSPMSPVIYKTPLKQFEARKNYNSNDRSRGISMLSSHCTPPSGLTKFIARNPFDAELTNRLHMSVISPTIFSKVPTKTHDSPFSWTIDELAMLKPVAIEEFSLQQSHASDPEVEKRAQEAINKFFSAKEIHPSPWNERRESVKQLMTTPGSLIEEIDSEKTEKTTRDCWAQTELSLPPKLPQHVEDALKPFFTFTQDQQVDNDEANSSSNSSLRRKLFFNHDDSIEDDSECSLILSPSKINSSPPRSGMMAHGTLIGEGLSNMQRTYDTSFRPDKLISPPDMSPICNPSNNLSNNSLRSRRSVTRLDFSAHMSVDSSYLEEKENNNPQLAANQETLNDTMADSVIESKEYNQNETVEMVSLIQETTPQKQSTKIDNVIKFKDSVDWCKNVITNESYKGRRNFTSGGFSDQSTSAFTSAQDTGYQTYSMNNTANTNTTNNRSFTPVKKGFNWDDRHTGMSSVSEIRLSDWQGNFNSVISSTPSKFIRSRENHI
ncbi:Similar to bora: Protein aurora borealis (Drosophila pseudoobscura pseudoobscura) [Cotesia congregata]|uniref:Protein aurora borealis n=1 Tax=Cotesia congregata TaxID=51543 RepID=A0A8J2HQT8_COTCN|nr:Similar to bora: Protein aurora borealis (Drosophila pseudoobscura pseudoobscura) [Cotesia congregata]